MEIKVTNCKDCIFRESNFNPDSIGYDTVDSCILLRNQDFKTFRAYYIASYDSWNEEVKPEALNKRLPDCPLDKEQIIVSL